VISVLRSFYLGTHHSLMTLAPAEHLMTTFISKESWEALNLANGDFRKGRSAATPR
jgi:hypothetical protein